MTEKSYLGEFGLTATMHRLPTPAPETMYIYPMTPDSMCMALVIKSGEKQETFTCYVRPYPEPTTEGLFVNLMYQISVTSSSYEDWAKLGLADVIGEESARAWYAYSQECYQKLVTFLGKERAEQIINKVVDLEQEDEEDEEERIEQELEALNNRFKILRDSDNTLNFTDIAEMAAVTDAYIVAYLEYSDTRLVDLECMETARFLLERIQEIMSKPSEASLETRVNTRMEAAGEAIKNLLNRERKEPDL